MGRKTACSRDEWRELASLISKGLRTKLREKYGGKIPLEAWNKTYTEALREAARLTISDCNVEEVAKKVLSKF